MTVVTSQLPTVAEVEEALKMTLDTFMAKYKCSKPSKEDIDIVFHCKKGARSQKALQIAHQLGYTKCVGEGC